MNKLTVEDVYEAEKRLLSRRLNDMAKIQVKCWVYHSVSRIKNGNEPFTLDNFNYKLGMGTFLDYINSDLINCEDLGGKEKACKIVQDWFISC